MHRRWRFVRDEHGRIIQIRSSKDPFWDSEWLRDPEVQAFFHEKDVARARARGALIDDTPAPEAAAYPDRKVAAQS